MSIKLTENVITGIKNGEVDVQNVQPVLQVADIRLIDLKDRYRILLTDGVDTLNGMLGSQLNHLVRSEQVQKGSVIRLKQFTANVLRGQVFLMITELDAIRPTCDPIGDQRQSLITYGSEPPTSMYPSPMRSINQPTTTMANPQNFTGSSHPGSVPRPNVTANSPIYPHNQDHRAGLHSYGMGNAPNRHSRPMYNQSPPMYNRGPMGKSETALKILPINALNPYQGRWTIKARVTAKAELRHYTNAKGDGKVFSFDLLDATGGEVRVTCFNDVADQFYGQIEAGKVYFVSKGSVKPAKKAFNHLKNDNEIMLDSSSTIQPCYDDDGSIPQQQFHFREIAEIEGLDNNSVLDIIGVVFRIFPSSIVKKKDGTETQKRNLHVKDMSGRSVDVTLWGNFCSTDGQTLQNLCDSGIFPILAIKSARVGEYNGKNVGTISTSKLFIDPDFPEARRIKVWFDNGGNNMPSVSLSLAARTDVRKTVSQIKDEKLGTSEKADWVTVSGNVSFLKVDSFYYTACPLTINDRKCNKKVTNNGDGKWRCDRCDQDVDECDYRYILQFQIQDHTGTTWVTAFEEGGEAIMGVAAKDLYCMKYEEQDDERFTEIIRNVLITKYNFKLKVKEETFNDDPRVKITVTKAEKINFSSETSFLLDMLKKDHPSSLVPMIEMPTAGSGPNPPNGNFAFKESAPYNNYMGNAGGGGRQTATMPASQMGQYGNQYGGSSRLNTSCNSCGGVGHTSINCPSVVNASGQRVISMASGGGRNSGASGMCYKCNLPGHSANNCPGVSNVTSAYGGGNAAQGRYGSASGQYVGGMEDESWFVRHMQILCYYLIKAAATEVAIAVRKLSDRFFYYFFSLLIITELDATHPICDHIGDQRQIPITYGGEPPTSMYPSPMQSINQPTTTMANPQNFTGSSHPGSVPRSNIKILSINALNPYQGVWTIKARVTAKAELRHYNNAKGDGKVFSFDLLDATGGEIRVTCFNAVADQFYDQIEAGKVYFVSKGNVKPAQKAFNHLKNDYEIILDSSSTIQPCYNDDGSIPQQQFHFRQIAEIEGLDNNSFLDIIGVVFRIFPSSIVKKKDGTETQKRNLHIKDMSGRSVQITLWGNFCNTDGQILQNMCDSGIFPVLAIKSARVGEYNGKNVGTIPTSKLFIDPDFPEAHRIKVWFDNGGSKMRSVSLSLENTDVRKTVSQIKDEKIGTSEKPDWITVSGNVGFLKVDSFYYTACPLTINDRKCNKKVTNNGDGKWRCDRCEKDVDECDYRYILQFQIQDHTGTTWVTGFEEGGEAMIGVTAKDLYCMKYEEQDDDRFTEIIRNVFMTKYNFKLKVKEETFNDDPRVKIIVTKAEKINLSETSFLLDMLRKDHPSSLVPKIEMSTAGSGLNPLTGNFAFKKSAPCNNYMGNAGGGGRRTATMPASQMGQYGNQYGGCSRLNTSCNSCGGVGHASMNYPSVGNASGQRVNSMASGGGRNSGASGMCYKCNLPGHWANGCPGVSNAASAYGGGNGAQGRYGSAFSVGGY
ncbi:Nucleic acid-binding, OB-fold [Artemisia annua]|uniref:Replication protein A subunit n=1 Tax=Artemisia annua TaxID=35608 RepID=A0A2U1PI58_ARTAN|nr:Nucleic acid-binding, OB-fold [Artemisia annua]